MASIPFADNYLAGSLLTLLLPTLLLIAIAVWYVIAVKKVPDTPNSSPALPPSEVVAAASQPNAEPRSQSTAAPTSPPVSQSTAEPASPPATQTSTEPPARQTATEPTPETPPTEPPATGE